MTRPPGNRRPDDSEPLGPETGWQSQARPDGSTIQSLEAQVTEPPASSADVDTSEDIPGFGNEAEEPASTSRSIFGGLLSLALAVGGLWLLQRGSLTWWLRLPGGFAAFITLMIGYLLLARDASDDAIQKVMGSVIIGVIALGVASAQGFWVGIPTSGLMPHTTTTRPTPPIVDTPTSIDTSSPLNDPTSIETGPPMNDPQNSNPNWIPCKDSLGYGGISDYLLTNGQEVQVVACVINADIGP